MIEDPVDPRFEGNTLVIETGNETEVYDSQFLVAALLIYVAKGDGSISDMETDKMLALVEQRFHLHGAESLALLTRAMTEMAENPDLENLLREISSTLRDDDKEEIAVMLLQVVAADGRKDVEELEKVNTAAEIIGISQEVMHRAFTRYFDEPPE